MRRRSANAAARAGDENDLVAKRNGHEISSVDGLGKQDLRFAQDDKP
jgi:hypothetical protein